MPTFFFHSEMTGAPTNTNAAGSTLGIIRACLVEGFNVLTPSSASVTSEVMTITYSSAHGYENLVWIRLDGATGGSIVKRATVTSSTTLTIEATGFSNGPVSGTLSTRVAPADWEEVFTGTLKAVFRSKVEGPGSTRFFYCVSDTVSGAQPSMFRGYVSMSDVDTGEEPFPSLAQQTGNGSAVTRANQSSPLPWVVVADGRSVYFFFAYYTYPNLYGHFFGDLAPIADVDNYFAGVFVFNNVAGYVLAGDNGNVYSPRNAAASPESTEQGMVLGIGTVSGARVFPSPVDGGVILHRPVLMMDGTNTNSAIRGFLRGLMHLGGSPIPSGSHWSLLDSVSGVSGRVLVVRDRGNTRAVAFSIDEDWA